ncbi:Vitamin B12 import ATP-binding protein BtuD [Streptomyces rimosus subsp. rimosus]
MIEAVGLTKRYGAKTAVHNLSFQVRPGTVTGFLGPNGSGKSTTMRMILGLDTPTSGRVTIGGIPFRKVPNAPRHVGALLDAKAVHGGRSARQHLLSLAQLSGIPARRVDEVLGVVGLQEVARKRSNGFSLGMGQRLGIAAALLGDPQVLLFDEPVNGLDPEGILRVRNLMKQLAAEGRTVFVSSHLMSEMALTAEHLIVIGRGQLLADMPVEGLHLGQLRRLRPGTHPGHRAGAAREARFSARRGGRPGRGRAGRRAARHRAAAAAHQRPRPRRGHPPVGAVAATRRPWKRRTCS